MRKKQVRKSIKSRVKPKNYISHYTIVYFVSLAVAIVLFAIASFNFVKDGTCANSKSCKTDLTEQVDNNTTGFFQGHKVLPPKIDLAMSEEKKSVLGTSDDAEDKHIYVDLSQQKLYAYQGSDKFMETFIASGRWGKTPVGNFNIWLKLRSTRMSGGEGADAYDLPNVPSVMYFYHDFGLHGAYWHNNFGHTMSHGCVNLRLTDAATLFDWADGPSGGKKGTAVSICNSFEPPDNCAQENPINQ